MEWGDDIKAVMEDEAVMLVNHQATGDVCTLMMCLQDKGLVSHPDGRSRQQKGEVNNQFKYLMVWNIDFNMYIFPENLEKLKRTNI